jgi:hypothetical protein
MMDLLATSAEVLSEAGFSTRLTSVESREALMFEDPTVLGFLFAYIDPAQLIKCWAKDAHSVVAGHQFGLRRASQKAWNTYVGFLAAGPANFAQSAALSAIEEDLTGTRKIARAAVAELADLRAALLPLLPLQAAPKLDSVDMRTEIRQRTTELPPRAVEAFLSGADEAVVIHVLEETQ